MKPLTPEQQAFAEEHHGLLLDFMASTALGMTTTTSWPIDT